MNKFEKFVYDAFAYLIMVLMAAVCITVPAAVVVWAIRWILIMFGVIV